MVGGRCGTVCRHIGLPISLCFRCEGILDYEQEILVIEFNL